MDENRQDKGSQLNTKGQQDSSGMPNMRVIKGLLAIIFGFMFVVFASTVVLQIIFFVIGWMFIYYGLRLLELRQASDYMERCMNKIRKFFPK